jgi:hypothetical protein
MKKLIVCLLMILICLTSISLNKLLAADEKFTKAMESVLVSIKSSETLESLQQAANRLERIAAAEPAEWLPAYWAAYCYINMSFLEKEPMRKDLYLDQADKLLQQAGAIDAQNDELLVLKAYAAQSRIAIDGQSRYMTYNGIFTDALQQARKLNPDNPRIYLLEGQMLYHMPEAFGGGKATACPKLKLALEKYAQFKPSSTINPDWGIKNAQYLVQDCGN